jgi:hypothetical protein
MGKRSTFTPDLRAMIDQWVAAGYVVEIDATEGKVKVQPPDSKRGPDPDLIDWSRK